MWMVAVPTAPGRCRCLWWFFQPSVGASKRLQKVCRSSVSNFCVLQLLSADLQCSQYLDFRDGMVFGAASRTCLAGLTLL